MEKELDLTISNYGTVRNLDYEIALLPWGATEPHNLHLPYTIDALSAHDVAVDAAKLAMKEYGVRAMVLPPVYFGQQNPGQRDLKFCIHTRSETQKAILTDIASSLYHQGMRRLLIINGHGGNSFKGMIRDLAVDFPDMMIGVSDWFKACPPKEYFDNPGDHADELETSVLMYYHPELVNLAEAGSGKSGGFAPKTLREGVAWIPRNWSKVSVDTGIGDPRAATAEKGARYVRDVAQCYAELIRDLCSDAQLYQPLT